MVLLAASICTKDGKALVSRQFVEMSKARIEGLITTFTKLLGTGKQHTFVETESVRYVYQPLEKLYLLLITTKASNILEDLETLRLFSRVIPEYARGTNETDILNNAFSLIFAFDEIIALGYREDVNFMQIRVYMEMDSYDEHVYKALLEVKENDAKRRARELEQEKLRASKRSAGTGFSSYSNYRSNFGLGSVSNDLTEPRVVMRDRFLESDITTNVASNVLLGKRNGMQLGGRGDAGKVDRFVELLQSEGESIADGTNQSANNDHLNQVNKAGTTKSITEKEDVHIRIEEKLSAQLGRDCTFELQGTMFVLAGTIEGAMARFRVDMNKAMKSANEAKPPIELQTHPNIDKGAFSKTGWIQIRAQGKAFPVGQEVSLLRWRLKAHNQSVFPITVNCWPNEIQGGFEVNVEFELQDLALTFTNLTISIPLPQSSKQPLVGIYDGEYNIDLQNKILEWRLLLVDVDNSSGSIDFTVKTERNSTYNDFFPIKVNFASNFSYSGVEVLQVTGASQNESMKYSCETNVFTEKYEVLPI